MTTAVYTTRPFDCNVAHPKWARIHITSLELQYGSQREVIGGKSIIWNSRRNLFCWYCFQHTIDPESTRRVPDVVDCSTDVVGRKVAADWFLALKHEKRCVSL